ncbi:MAG TPA: hypothetical protein VL527_05695 [Dongiaceae bacterium]|nr:hypothetical protein [Dongiaceae bacterium]
MKSLSLKAEPGRWLVVVTYALAMAWVEAAVVFYLRTMIDRVEPYQAEPLPRIGGFALAELVRELATLVMLLTVGMLAGKTWRARLGYTMIAFGVWDIFYYVFLKVLCGWPHSVWDWDILFLVPLPWWGPVLAPVLIAGLMILWGTLASQFEPAPAPRSGAWKIWTACGTGTLLALYVFMADALRVVDGTGVALRHLLPVRFDWGLFAVALVLMSAPLLPYFPNISFRQPLPIREKVTD